jgi:hypothetical protein
VYEHGVVHHQRVCRHGVRSLSRPPNACADCEYGRWCAAAGAHPGGRVLAVPQDGPPADGGLCSVQLNGCQPREPGQHECAPLRLQRIVLHPSPPPHFAVPVLRACLLRTQDHALGHVLDEWARWGGQFVSPPCGFLRVLKVVFTADTELSPGQHWSRRSWGGSLNSLGGVEGLQP